MSKLSFDYSKWDRLELSDDEDTHHPNLDKNLNIRVNRITRDRKEEEIDEEKRKLEEKGELDKAAKVEKKRPLHVGNVCRVADERTIIQGSSGTTDRISKGEEFTYDEYQGFKQDHAKVLEAFVEADWEQSHQMLNVEGGILLDENANSWFLLNTLQAEMDGNKERAMKLGRQGQIISQIHQLAKPMNRPPRDLVHRFFEKFNNGDAQGAFQEGVDHFMKNIKQRAADKKKEEAEEAEKQRLLEEEGEKVSLIEAMYDMSEEERKGPGGLDPIDVYESLPEELQNCFKSGDIPKLKKVAEEMERSQFEYHFQRCIDSGLWNAG